MHVVFLTLGAQYRIGEPEPVLLDDCYAVPILVPQGPDMRRMPRVARHQESVAAVVAVLFALVLLGCAAHASTLQINYSPLHPKAGEVVGFYITGFVPSGELKCSIQVPGDWRIDGVPGSDSWITLALVYTWGEPAATIVFPYPGEYEVSLWYTYRLRSTSNPYVVGDRYGTVTVMVSGDSSSGTPSMPPAQPSTPATVASSLPPLSSPPPASTPPSSSPGTIPLGGYTLRLVNAIKCVSVLARPYTSIAIGAVGATLFVHLPMVLVDSGADMSIFPMWVATALGIDLSSSEEVKFGGVGGGEVVGYKAQVRIGITHLGGIETNVDGYTLGSGGEPYLPTITVAFVDDDSEFILGRVDAFDLFDFDFTSDTVTIRVPQ